MQNSFREVHDKIMFKNYGNPNYRIHLHEDIEMLYVVNGSGNAICNGTVYNLKDGDCFIAFPNQMHQYSDFTSGNYYLIIINPSNLLSYTNLFFECEPTSSVVNLKEGYDDNILFLIKTSLSEYLRDGYSTVIEAYITTIFGKLLKHYETIPRSVSRSNVFRILNYCSKNYKKNLSVDDVASALSISRSTISHIFSKHLKIGFCDYVNMLKLVDARALLRNTDMSIIDIAQSAGFETIRTFNRAFLKERGISPSQYRKNQKSSKK